MPLMVFISDVKALDWSVLKVGRSPEIAPLGKGSGKGTGPAMTKEGALQLDAILEKDVEAQGEFLI